MLLKYELFRAWVSLSGDESQPQAQQSALTLIGAWVAWQSGRASATSTALSDRSEQRARSVAPSLQRATCFLDANTYWRQGHAMLCTKSENAYSKQFTYVERQIVSQHFQEQGYRPDAIPIQMHFPGRDVNVSAQLMTFRQVAQSHHHIKPTELSCHRLYQIMDHGAVVGQKTVVQLDV